MGAIIYPVVGLFYLRQATVFCDYMWEGYDVVVRDQLKSRQASGV